MAFDGLVTKSVVYELNNSLVGGKIDKIFCPSSDEVLIGVYVSGIKYALNINISSANYRINLTTNTKPNPLVASNFCMVLRKHLTGGTIKKIYMNGLERIIYIDVDCYNDFNDLVTKTIVIELMGKHSNVILLNSDNTIIDSLRHLDKLDNSLRDILPGYKYSVLDSSKQDFTTSTFDDFYKILQNAESIATALSNYYTGFSKAGISYILSDLDINTEKISLDDYKRLYKYLKDIISGNPLLCYKIDGKKDDFYVKLQNSDNFQVNFFIDDFYFGKEEKEKFSSYQNDLLRLILNRLKRLEDKLSTANQSLNECSKMEDYRLYGELITANLYRIQNYNQTSITLENYYKNNEPIDIKLDGSISPSANAKKFFKKYKKLQNTYSIVQKQKELITAEIEYLDSIVYEINNCQTLQDLESVYSEISESLDLKINDKNTPKKNEKVNSSMPTELTIDGFTILVGKNNKQNDYLTCRIAKSSDLWFHTKDIHGSHVVLKLNKNKSATDSIIYKCATIAAYYSKAKLSQNVPVDYTYIKYVRKPNGAKPGMVIYTNNKTLYVNPKKP